MSTATSTIPEIDFLPAEYRESHGRNKTQPWRLVVSLGAVVLVAATSMVQAHRRHQLAAELAAVAPRYDAATETNLRLGTLQTELASAQAEAELITYLRHPWPRTRILDALLGPLPDTVVLEELQVHAENIRQRGNSGHGSRGEKAKEETLKKLAPAARDLKQLRGQCDARQTVVVLTGTTTETAALHQYLGELARVPLFAKAELTSMETDSKNPGQRQRFSALLVVRPGYGQPGGPVPSTACGLAGKDGTTRNGPKNEPVPDVKSP